MAGYQWERMGEVEIKVWSLVYRTAGRWMEKVNDGAGCLFISRSLS